MSSARPWKAIGLAVVVLLALAPSAVASSFTKTGTTLVFTDGAAAQTTLSFSLDCCDYDRWEITERDDSPAGLTRSLDVPAGCTRATSFDGTPIPDRVYCPVTSFTRVEANMGDRDDNFDGPYERNFPEGSAVLTPVYPVTVDLGPGNDDSTSGIGADSITGGDGEDNITTSQRYFTDPDSPEAGDTVDAGPDADTVSTSAGDDVVDLGNGGDPAEDFQSLDTGAGDDTVDVSTGNTSIRTEEGDDTVTATGGGRNSVTLGGGRDSFAGSVGNDSVDGGDGVDDIVGDEGENSLDGDEGNDTLTAGDGGNDLDGGPGNDTLTSGEGDDNLDGGDGDDVVTAGGGNNSGFDSDGDDEVTAGDGDDSFTAGPGVDVLRLNGGDDSARGGDGNDDIDVADGDDDADGGAGDDLVLGGDGTDSIDGGDGNDVVNGEGGDDGDEDANRQGYVAGGNGADTVRGGTGDDLVSGGDRTGEESAAGRGNDVVSGGDGVDSTDFYGLDLRIRISLDGAANDTALSSTGQALEADNLQADIENLSGTSNDDELVGNESVNEIEGGSGRDRLFGRGNDDFLEGDSGNDTIDGEAGNDTVIGGPGIDTFYGDTPNDLEDIGNDQIRAQDGIAESISCGQGSDTAFIDFDDRVPDFGVADACETVNRTSPPPADQTPGGNNTNTGTGGTGGTGGGTVTPPDTTGPEIVIPSTNRSLTASRSFVVPFVFGPVSENTTGTISLKTDGKVKAGARAAAKAKVIALGSKAFQVLKDQKITVKIKLNKAGKRVLRKKRTLKVQANITMRDATGNATIEAYKFTLKAPKKKKKRK